MTVRKKEGVSTVSVYDFDESSLSKLDVLSFDGADEAWLDFVSANRNGTAPESSHDLIKGPVADDDVFRTFLLYSAGVLTKSQTLEALKVKKLFDQYVFASEKALGYLTFLKAEVITV